MAQTLYVGRTEGTKAMTRLTVVKSYLRVREARQLTGLSQEQLAGELGVSRSALAQWEMADGTCPSVQNLIALAQRSGMAFEYLSTGRGVKIHGKPTWSLPGEPPQYQNLAPQHKRLLAAFDMLTPKQRSGLLDLLDMASSRSPLARGRD